MADEIKESFGLEEIEKMIAEEQKQNNLGPGGGTRACRRRSDLKAALRPGGGTRILGGTWTKVTPQSV